jgi:hypothetical protein
VPPWKSGDTYARRLLPVNPQNTHFTKKIPLKVSSRKGDWHIAAALGMRLSNSV